MKDEMKTKRLVARIDDKTLSLIKEASEKSGIPASKIIRDGALAQAVSIISICNKTVQHVTTNSQEGKTL